MDAHSSKSKHNLAMWSEVSGDNLDCGNSQDFESGQRSPFRDRDDDSGDDDVKPTLSKDNVAGNDSSKIVGRGLHLSSSSDDDDDINFIPRSRRSDSPYTKHRPAKGESRLSLPVEVQSIAGKEGTGGGKSKYKRASFFKAVQLGRHIIKKQQSQAEEAHDGDLGGPPSSRNPPTPPGSGSLFTKLSRPPRPSSRRSASPVLHTVFPRPQPESRVTRMSLPEIKGVGARGAAQRGDVAGTSSRKRPPSVSGKQYWDNMMLMYQAEMGAERRQLQVTQPVDPVPLRINDKLYIGELAARNAKAAIENEQYWQQHFSKDANGGKEEHPSKQAVVAMEVASHGPIEPVLSGEAARAWQTLLPSNFEMLAAHNKMAICNNARARRQKGVLEEFVRLPRSEMRVVAVQRDGEVVVKPVIPPPPTWPKEYPRGDSKEHPISVD
jgi:hypothetical protein